MVHVKGRQGLVVTRIGETGASLYTYRGRQVIVGTLGRQGLVGRVIGERESSVDTRIGKTGKIHRTQHRKQNIAQFGTDFSRQACNGSVISDRYSVDDCRRIREREQDQ